MTLDIPPRYMWGWGPKVSGFCGSATVQTTAIYYGNWLSQDLVRGMTGGHDGLHELMLGRGGCCSTVDIMQKFSLAVEQWPFWTAKKPQSPAFVRWLADAAAAGHPVSFGVYMQTEDNPEFDHIVPLVGFDDAQRLLFNDLHANVSMRETLSSFISTRDACRKALPWAKRFAYCTLYENRTLDLLATTCAAAATANPAFDPRTIQAFPRRSTMECACWATRTRLACCCRPACSWTRGASPITRRR